MKQTILILGIVLFFAGCHSSFMPRQTIYYGYDFRPYTEKGFMFTTEGYEGVYESVATFAVVMFPEIKEVKTNKSLSGYTREVEEISAAEVIDSMYTKAVNMGANAVIRFSVKPVNKLNGLERIEGIEVFGFAIKRK